MSIHRSCFLRSVLSKNPLCVTKPRTVFIINRLERNGSSAVDRFNAVGNSKPNKTAVLQILAEPDQNLQQKQLEESELKEHILKLHDYIVSFAIPKFFSIRHPWAIYSKNVHFENRLWDQVETANGLDAYAWKLLTYRFGAILSYARSKLEVVGSRVDGKDITIHWRFSGVPQSAVFLTFWRFKPWKLKQVNQENSRIIEGISTLSVGSDKLVFKHVIDRLILDQNFEESKSEEALLEKLQKVRRLAEEKAHA